MDYKGVPQLKDINIPYYVQIYDVIYGMIQEGKLCEGDTLPGENNLASYWKVSRSTVRMAIRKLVEDGYINKMQGKKTTVTGQLARNKYGLQHISNPCIGSCVEAISAMEDLISVQNGGRLVSDLLGYQESVFTAVAVDIKYFVQQEHVASSVAVIPVLKLEEFGIAIDDHERIRQMALNDLYERAKRSQLSMSAVEWNEEEIDKPKCSIIVVMDEVLFDDKVPISYHKYWMDSNWYRFSLDRRL